MNAFAMEKRQNKLHKIKIVVFFRLFCLVTKENGKNWDDRGTL